MVLLSQSYNHLDSYEASFYLSSPFGSADLDVFVKKSKQEILINIKDTLNDSTEAFLLYQNNRWAFKENSPDSEFYFISDKTFLKYLHLENILPNSHFITEFLQGRYPYQDRIPSNIEYKISAKGSSYSSIMKVKNFQPEVYSLLDKNNNLHASLKYESKGIKSKGFFIPSFLNIYYKVKNIHLNLILTAFKKTYIKKETL